MPGYLSRERNNGARLLDSPPRHSSISQALSCASVAVERGTATRPRGVTVRAVRNAAEMDEVYRMTYEAYRERGYCRPCPNGRLKHYPHLDGIPATTVLVAVAEGRLIGTSSLTLDGPCGLPGDRDFEVESARIRREGRRLAAAWRIATRKTHRGERETVMALIGTTTRLALQLGVETCLFTLNPRHERIYQRLLHLKRVAQRDGTEGLLNAPAVFMRLNREECPPRFFAP